MRFSTTLVAAILLAAGCGARAGVGLTALPGVAGDSPVTVFYPTAQPEAKVKRGPFTLSVAEQAPATPGNGRLVVISHGSGGNPWVHSDLARALVAAGFVVAMPLHRGDNAQDPSTPGPESWKLRPAEASRAIDAVAASPFAASLQLQRVGVYGFSAGGHTALTFAGGRWSPSQFLQHCEQHIADDFPFCVGLAARLRGDALDDVKKATALFVLRRRFAEPQWYTHGDARVQAVVAAMPAAADFDAASLARPRIPLALVTAAKDKWLAPDLHSGAILKACLPRCRLLADLATAGHGAELSPPPPMERLPEIAVDLLSDPPGFDRKLVPAVHQRIVSFFIEHLE